MSAITVYTTPNCPGCKLTMRALNKRGFDYQVINLADHPEDIATMRALGHFQAPVVLLDDGRHWSGFRPDTIKNLVA